MKRIILLIPAFLFLLTVTAQVNLNNLKNKVSNNSGANTEEPSNLEKSDAETNNSGNILYVSIQNGSNKNDGSINAPLKNIDKAIEKSGPGDKIYIAGGKYSGTFNIGYLETDKAVQLYGSWDESFQKQNIVETPTVFQPDNAASGSARKALLRFTKDVAGTVIDGIVWDMGERNAYSPKEGFVEGVEGGRMLSSTEKPANGFSTVEEPCISILSATTGGDVTIQNCVFVNGANFAIQAGHRSGTFKVINNVFVANKMAAIEIYGTCAGSNQKKDMTECGNVEIAYNTILFTWSRLKDFLDMGYGVRIMTKCSYNIHHNIIGCSIMGGIDNTRFCKDEYIKIDHNILFGNKGGDLEYSPASNTELKLKVSQFEDLEFASVTGNSDEVPSIKLDQAYLKAFYSARYSENLNYDPNSSENQWARILGMNQQGTMTSSVSMFMNKYPWKETLKLFGASLEAGAQDPN
jgi:hypothetical protein